MSFWVSGAAIAVEVMAYDITDEAMQSEFMREIL